MSLNVVVRDGRGRPVKDLALADFQVFDEGRLVRIDDFRAGVEPISIALLMDMSGSMSLGDRLTVAKQAAEILFGQLGAQDEVGLFTFDRELRNLVPFSTDLSAIRRGLDLVTPYGSTSLHDAAAAAASTLTGRPSSRRAVIAISDGLDTSSRLTASAASSAASAVDVPVYVMAIADLNRVLDPKEVALEPIEVGVARLDDLTGRTGGVSFQAESPARALVAARHIVTDLRAGYVLAFAPQETPGWHQLSVQVARKDARVRTRAGYWIGAPPGAR